MDDQARLAAIEAHLEHLKANLAPYQVPQSFQDRDNRRALAAAEARIVDLERMLNDAIDELTALKAKRKAKR